MIRPIVSKLEDLPVNEIGGHDLVFGCLDNIAARLHLNSHSYHRNVPYIDGGTDGMNGRVQVVLPDGPCLQCGMNRSHSRVMEKRYSCAAKDVKFFEPHMAAEITTTSVIAAIQVREGLKIASGREEDCLRHVLHYNGTRNTSDVYELTLNPECSMVSK